MADANQAADDLARALQKVNEELALLGKTTQQTQNDLKDAQMKAKYGIENYTKGTEKAAEGVMALGRGAAAAGKAMLDGKKGAAALNSSLDELATAATAAGAALALMIPGGILIKGLIAGVTAATGAFIKYTQAANEMADQLHKGYTGIAKAGGAAADGMTGLKRDAQKLGLAMTELDQMVSLVTENSKDFALFAGSVADGRKKFADLGQAMTPARQELLNMGLEIKDINEGMAGYVRLQTRLGNAQKMSVDQLAKGATEYLKEQDMLTKLTGQSRAEMEQQRERALQKEQFAAKIRELQLNGQKEAAENLLKLNSIYEAAGPETASAFQASVTGNLSNADAQKANLASQGEMIRSTQQVIAGQISYQEAAQRTGKAMSNTADTVGTTLGQLGAYNNNFGNLAEQIKLGQLAQGDIVANSKKISEDQKAQRAGADKITDNQSKLIQTQIEANKAMTDFVFKGIAPAQEKMIALAKATGMAAKGLDEALNGGGYGKDKTGSMAGSLASTGAGAAAGALAGSLVGPIGTAIGGIIGGAAGFMGYELFGGGGKKVGGADKIPKAADGGLLTGPMSGYMAMLHGTELVIPEDQLAGKIDAGAMAGAGSEQLDKLNSLYKDILKDTIAIDKLNEADLKRKKDFDFFSKRLMDLKVESMKDEIESLSSGGASGMMGSAMQWMSGSGAPVTSGSGLPVMSGGGATPGMGGAQGLQIKSQDDLKSLGLRLKTGDVQAEGAKISPKIIELAKAIQSSVPGFGMFTGFNDKFHNEKAPSSQHTKGLAVDFTVAKPPTKEEGKAVTDWLKQMGASLAIDEYNNPSSGATAGHYHAQIPAFKDGGLVDEATLSLIGEGGPEAVIPLKDGNVPVSFNGKMGLGDEAMGLFKVMAEQTAAMAAMMEQMVSAQKNSVDVQTKMLRAQS